MKMQFIGRSSNGFRVGQTYELIDMVQPSRIDGCMTRGSAMIWLSDVNSNAAYPYGSVAAIMKNWLYIGE